jgi:hypothetical protein
MALTLQTVPLAKVHEVWPKVQHWIQESVQYSGGAFDLDSALVYASHGQWQLILIVDSHGREQGIIAVELINHYQQRVAWVTALGGSAVTTAEAYGALKAWAKSQGATDLQAGCRAGMVRLLARLGMTARYTVIGERL